MVVSLSKILVIRGIQICSYLLSSIYLSDMQLPTKALTSDYPRGFIIKYRIKPGQK